MRAKPRKGFGERLAALRNKRGLRQEDVAHDLDVTLGTISRWERGENLPHADQIKAIVQYFDTTADHLVMGTPTEAQGHTPEFNKFLSSDYGLIAKQRGWLNFIATAQYPSKPTVRLYKELVHAFMRAYDENDGP